MEFELGGKDAQAKELARLLKAARVAERERCVKVLEDSLLYDPDDPAGYYVDLIRKSAKP